MIIFYAHKTKRLKLRYLGLNLCPTLRYSTPLITQGGKIFHLEISIFGSLRLLCLQIDHNRFAFLHKFENSSCDSFAFFHSFHIIDSPFYTKIKFTRPRVSPFFTAPQIIIYSKIKIELKNFSTQ